MNWHRMPCLGLWTADVEDRDLSFLLRPTELGEYQVVAYTVHGEFLYRAGESIAQLQDAKQAAEDWYRTTWAAQPEIVRAFTEEELEAIARVAGTMDEVWQCSGFHALLHALHKAVDNCALDPGGITQEAAARLHGQISEFEGQTAWIECTNVYKNGH